MSTYEEHMEHRANHYTAVPDESDSVTFEPHWLTCTNCWLQSPPFADSEDVCPYCKGPVEYIETVEEYESRAGQ